VIGTNESRFSDTPGVPRFSQLLEGQLAVAEQGYLARYEYGAEVSASEEGA